MNQPPPRRTPPPLVPPGSSQTPMESPAASPATGRVDQVRKSLMQAASQVAQAGESAMEKVPRSSSQSVGTSCWELKFPGQPMDGAIVAAIRDTIERMIGDLQGWQPVSGLSITDQVRLHDQFADAPLGISPLAIPRSADVAPLAWVLTDYGFVRISAHDRRLFDFRQPSSLQWWIEDDLPVITPAKQSRSQQTIEGLKKLSAKAIETIASGRDSRLPKTSLREGDERFDFPRLMEHERAIMQAMQHRCALIAQRKHPAVLRPQLERWIQDNQDEQAASELSAVVSQDVALFAEAASLLQALVQSHPERSPDSPLPTLLRRWRDAESELGDHWYVRTAIAGTPGLSEVRGPYSFNDLQQMADAGQLAADDDVRHLCGGNWQRASQQMRETGHLPIVGRGTNPQWLDSMPEIVASLRELHPEIAFQFLTPVMHVDGNATTELFGVTSQGYAVVSVEDGKVKAVTSCDAELARIAWRREGGLVTVSISEENQELEFWLLDGAAADCLASAIDQRLIASAERAMESQRLFAAEMLLRQMTGDAFGAERSRLREAMGLEAEWLVVYQGGHPELSTKTLGTLSLDREGMEFTAFLPGDATHLRFPFSAIVDVFPPARGKLGEELKKAIESDRRNKRLLRAGLGTAAALMMPGSSLLVLGMLQGGADGSNSASNRLTLAARIDSVVYRLIFDGCGDDLDALEQRTEEFWQATLRFKNRFQHSSDRPSERSAKGETDRRDPVLLEIRDLLRTLVILTAGDRLPGIQANDSPLPDTFSADLSKRIEQWLDDFGNSPPADRSDASSTAKSIVVACPACGQKMRAAKPGVVQCPKCRGKLRVAPESFSGKSK